MNDSDPGPVDRYDFNGYRVAVHADSEEIRDWLRSVYERFRTPSDRPAVAGDVRADPELPDLYLRVEDQISGRGEIRLSGGFRPFTLFCRSAQHFDLERYESAGTFPSPMAFAQWYVLESLAHRARDSRLVHAGAVTWCDDALVIPAESGRGKTTLTLALLERGFGFLSDETAWIELDSRRVLPFPRRMNASEASRRLLGGPSWPRRRGAAGTGKEWFLDPADIALARDPTPGRLRWLVFPVGFATRPRLAPLAPREALLRLVRLCLGPPRRGAAELFELAPVLEGTTALELVAGPPGATAEALAEHLALAERRVAEVG